MKRIAIFTVLMLSVYIVAAQKPEPKALPTPIPQLSTADKLAIQSLQKTQESAAKEWNEAEMQKVTILREWMANHPGFHIHYVPQNQNDPQNFAVEADSQPVPSAKSAESAKTPEAAKK